jgi:uncharacterized protein (DUF362 family)
MSQYSRVKAHVLLSKGEDPYCTTRNVLQSFALPDLEEKRILIKPNAARLASPGEGVTTHPLVIAATIDHLRGKNVKEIIIGESCIFGVDAKEAFQRTGLKTIADERRVELLDLDRLDPMELTIPRGRLLRKIKVSSILKDVDIIISIPVMKTHMHTQVTLSLKNMKGLLWRREKARFHHLSTKKEMTRGYKTLDMAISEMAMVLRPHLTIIDGTVGMEGMGPAYGRPKAMGIVIVGDNALSADAVAARLMGFQPGRIPHLRFAQVIGLGEIHFKRISVDPKDYLKWVDPFEPPPARLSIPFPDVVVHDKGSCSACLSTLLVFLRSYYRHLDDYRLADKKIHVGIGKHLDSCPKGTILIGNCASTLKRKGIFIKGCPPISSQIMSTLDSSTLQRGVKKRSYEA